ncbi:MAG: nucleoside transporter C-terminal domain-containing protein [Vicinamibacteria bacterium]
MQQNLISFLGLFVLIGLAWLMSEDRKRFPVRVVVWGLILQLSFGFLVLKWEPGEHFFSKLNDVFNALLSFSTEGAKFVFASLGSVGSGSLQDFLTRLGKPSTDPQVQQAIAYGTVPGFSFAFQVLPTIIFFSALLSILYYLGIMQKVVVLFAKIMSKTMQVSGAESLSNSANIFVGQTEAPLVVAPYIEKMTRSELMAIMVGGFSNTAGGVLGAYVLMLQGYFPKIAGHLITASLLSAPAAFIIAKVMVPEKEVPLTKGDLRMDVPTQDANILDAVSNGTTVGWNLAINVGAMLISFVAIAALLNYCFAWFGGYFRDSAGIAQFDLMLLAAAAGLVYMDRAKPISEDNGWWALAVVMIVSVLARNFISDGAGAAIGFIGIFSWIPLFLRSGEDRGFGKGGYVTLGIIALVANVAYFGFGPMNETTDLSMQLVLGWLHWPIAFIMGVPAQDCLAIGKLLGEKLILTEFVAYLDLANQLGQAARNEIPMLDGRSIVIVTYALCGFANFASIGIQIGGMAPLAPSRRQDIARLGFKSMMGGALATFMIACIAGIFYDPLSTIGRVR